MTTPEFTASLNSIANRIWRLGFITGIAVGLAIASAAIALGVWSL
jgi:hypothetical protein